jgi:hypothetical protein
MYRLLDPGNPLLLLVHAAEDVEKCLMVGIEPAPGGERARLLEPGKQGAAFVLSGVGRRRELLMPQSEAARQDCR